jgi:hypothetical protein
MSTLFDTTHASTDAGTSAFVNSDAIDVDTDADEQSIDWDSVPVVEMDGAVTERFDTNQFYRIDATVARPIPQPYTFNDSLVWLKKPREELQKAAWSVDNSYWTHSHPDTSTGMVRDVSDVRGFWKHPRYSVENDSLDADLFFPVTDEESRAFIEQYGDVSVGFRHRNTRVDEYDGIVGGTDSDVELTGYQTDILVNHVASVRNGRCSSEEGCGVQVTNTDDSNLQHGHVTAVTDSDLTADTDYNISGFIRGIDITYDYEDEDGTYYAVAPDENPDDEPKYPINSCSDVSDAWKLRSHGDMEIEVSTLENRIQERARELDCDVPESDESDTTDSTMTDTCTDCGGDGVSIDAADMSIDYLADEHEGVSEAIDKAEQYDDLSERVDSLLDTLEVESLDSAVDAIEMKEDKLADLEERVTAIDREEAEEHAEYIREHYDAAEDRWDDLDELVESADVETLRDRRNLVEDFVDTENTETTTANPDGGQSQSTSRPKRKTPW